MSVYIPDTCRYCDHEFKEGEEIVVVTRGKYANRGWEDEGQGTVQFKGGTAWKYREVYHEGCWEEFR